MSSPHAILSGVVVLERPDRLCVSLCGSLLAELGATVLHVAGAERDIGLTNAARLKAKELINEEKTIITASSEAVWPRLVDRADIILFGYDESERTQMLVHEGDRRIVCAFSSFGTDGPAETQHAGETALQAFGGMMASTGMPGGIPERANIPIVETFAAVNATTAILASLRTGKSAVLDIAVYDSAIALLATFVSTVAAGRHDGYRIGCAHHLCAPWNAYRAADGWIELCSTTDEHWQSILRLIGRDDLKDDTRFLRSRDRLQNVRALDEIIGEWVAARSAEEAASEFLRSGLPAGRVRTMAQIVGDSDLRARGTVVALGRLDDPTTRIGSFLSVSLGDAREGSSHGKAADADAVLAALGPRETQAGRTTVAGGPPLQGVRVVEIGAYTAGPLAGRYLADLGAEVIKIEAAGGEVSRGWLPQFGGHSGYFVNCNLGKASVVLDLKNKADHARFLELVRTADVLLESLRPGALNNLGLGPDTLLSASPRLIYCSISGFGRAAGSRPALDTVVQAEGGLMRLVGQADRPQRVGVSIADQAAAHTAPLLILASLRRRAISGAGGHIDLSMQDVLLWFSRLACPDGDAALVPFATLEAADGWVMTRGGPPPEHVVVQVKTMRRDAAVGHLQGIGLEALGILEMGEAFAHEAIRRRNLVQFIKADGAAMLPILCSPYRFGLTPAPERLPGAPGADTARIFGNSVREEPAGQIGSKGNGGTS